MTEKKSVENNSTHSSSDISAEEFTQRMRKIVPRLKEIEKKNGPGPDYGKLHVEAMRKIKFD